MNRLAADEYFAADRSTDWKCEFDSGRLLEVPHPNCRHVAIAANVAATLSRQVRDRTTEVYASRMRVKVNAVGFYAYPDIVLANNPRFEENESGSHTLLDPIALIEIFSDSTEASDRGKKFAHYRRLESLREYLLIAQDRCHVEHYVRQPDDRWLLSETDDLAGRIELPSIECRLNLADFYLKVEFPDDDQGERA